ncbi:HAT C-terminal dimerization domain [Arabidopsis suecica]|uniref:HAT C-terminal dimerization domain n=1 Tax=Arabidopsis suecica TaxID=45249 RepID=A0A8T2B9R7_ARASU|nr:HAT C-terminal dimerization domain [Arabidopsis suecica]
MSKRNTTSNKRKEPESPTESPKTKRKLPPRSPAWNVFTRLEKDENRCSCNYCGKIYSCNPATCGTSNMNTHMKKCKAYLDHVESDSQNVLVSSGGRTSGAGMIKPFDQNVCRQATVKMIIIDELPFSFVENDGFKHFCEMAVPWFTIPSRRTITRDAVGLYRAEKTALKTILSRNRQAMSRIISFSPIPDHKGETIANQFLRSLDDWGIEKVFSITLDNASANDKAITVLKERLSNRNSDALMMNGDFMHIRCCAHILNLIANEGLDDISKSIISVRNAVKYVRSSNSRLESFKRWVEVEKITRGSVVLDCVTRWNSTYLMLKSALKYKVAFDRMADMDKPYDAWFKELDSNGKKRKGPPMAIDWDKARHMVRFLKAFYDSTLAFSSSIKVTSNGCYNEICKIQSSVQSMAFSDDSDLRDMASSMKVKFDKYWEGTEKINKILIVAGVLDPRRKMVFTMFSFELIYGKGNPKCIEMKELVMGVLEKLFKIYSVRYANSNLQSSAARDCENVTQVHQDSESMEVDNIDDPFLKFMVAKKTSLEVVDELQKYLKDELHVTTENSLGLPFDLLDWWKTNSSKYPIMSLMAREILAVPVSSVASESAFSTGGRILDQYRSCLTPDMVEALVLTQDWLRAALRSEAMKSLDNLEEENKFLDSLEEEFNPPSPTEKNTIP